MAGKQPCPGSGQPATGRRIGGKLAVCTECGRLALVNKGDRLRSHSPAYGYTPNADDEATALARETLHGNGGPEPPGILNQQETDAQPSR